MSVLRTKYTCLGCRKYFCIMCSVFENDDNTPGWDTSCTMELTVETPIRELKKNSRGRRRRQAVEIFRHNPCVFLSMYLLWFHCLFQFSLKFNCLQRVFLNEKIADNCWIGPVRTRLIFIYFAKISVMVPFYKCGRWFWFPPNFVKHYQTSKAPSSCLRAGQMKIW